LKIDQERIKRAVSEIIAAIGEDESREGLRDTPRRIAEMYEEVFEGLENPKEESRWILSLSTPNIARISAACFKCFVITVSLPNN